MQLSDALPEPSPDVTDETMHARQLPGEGAAHVVEIVQTLDAIGCTAPIGVEVFSDALWAMDPGDAARRDLRRDRAGAGERGGAPALKERTGRASRTSEYN